MGVARKLVKAAADAGADLVKFQTFTASKIASANAPKAAYQQTSTGTDESQLEMVRKLELSREDHYDLMQECKECGIGFFSTGFDIDSLDFLFELGIDRVKIPSGEITNLPLLRHVAGRGLPIILSTGMANLGEIESAVDVLEDGGADREDLTILHCNTEYPTPMHDVNLRAMANIGRALGTSHGYSDHTAGIEVSIAAVALGASVIEKHFTLDRTLPGPDHAASLEPEELRAMVRSIRNIEAAMSGDGIKRPSPSEVGNRSIVRKSIVAACPISKGEAFTVKNLTTKRPGDGVSPMRWDAVIGQVAQKNYVPDEMIEISSGNRREGV
ncbi:N-acetylneuraminate synthase [Erythrobacter jejuensis]|uniref:N-acetylneuraminate synthase n=2 Tax=Parerythrobacter jejuensis TaxID=795812 RepID=A0A845AWI2_9SPHN|nr:N-acetylneuraminate synthase [Parerythrobacter jejuensis]MXP33647.1 N-acetylneuraminate synthase [Parerythrobacter jejuensis]